MGDVIKGGAYSSGTLIKNIVISEGSWINFLLLLGIFYASFLFMVSSTEFM